VDPPACVTGGPERQCSSILLLLLWLVGSLAVFGVRRDALVPDPALNFGRHRSD
jgi:hypothetical protein